MKCEACGAMNPEGMKFCGNCGRPLASVSAGPTETRTRICVQCGRPISWDAQLCMYCGHDYRAAQKKGTEGQLMTGAILTLLSGFLGIAILLIIWVEEGTVPGAIFWLSLVCCGLGIVGGFAALMRMLFPLAVLGAAAALFNPAFFLAIPGLILIASSAARFKDYVAEAPA